MAVVGGWQDLADISSRGLARLLTLNQAQRDRILAVAGVQRSCVYGGSLQYLVRTGLT